MRHERTTRVGVVGVLARHISAFLSLKIGSLETAAQPGFGW
jgi:hypothetical protein